MPPPGARLPPGQVHLEKMKQKWLTFLKDEKGKLLIWRATPGSPSIRWKRLIFRKILLFIYGPFIRTVHYSCLPLREMNGMTPLWFFVVKIMTPIISSENFFTNKIKLSYCKKKSITTKKVEILYFIQILFYFLKIKMGPLLSNFTIIIIYHNQNRLEKSKMNNIFVNLDSLDLDSFVVL